MSTNTHTVRTKQYTYVWDEDKSVHAQRTHTHPCACAHANGNLEEKKIIFDWNHRWPMISYLKDRICYSVILFADLDTQHTTHAHAHTRWSRDKLTSNNDKIETEMMKRRTRSFCWLKTRQRAFRATQSIKHTIYGQREITRRRRRKRRRSKSGMANKATMRC